METSCVENQISRQFGMFGNPEPGFRPRLPGHTSPLTLRQTNRCFFYSRVLTLLTCVVLLGSGASLQAQSYNPNDFDAIRTLSEFENPHKDLVLLASHRGNHALVDGKYPMIPENSLQAIGLAAQSGIEIIELDIKLTSDGVPVLSHDMTWGRETCLGVFGHFDPFGTPYSNDSYNPTVSSKSLADIKYTGIYSNFYLRDTISLDCTPQRAREYPPTLQEALDYMTQNKISMAISLDLRDAATAAAAWKVIATNKDYLDRFYQRSTLFKVPGKSFASPDDVYNTFSPGVATAPDELANFIPVYNTADISPGAIADTLFGGVDVGPGPSGYGSEDNIIRSFQAFENDRRFIVAGVEVSVKQVDGILTKVLNAARTNARTGQPMAVGIFSPFADYYAPSDPNRADPLFFKTNGYCCVRLSDFFYNGAPNNQPSDTADNRASLLYLNVQGFNFITTDNPVSYDAQFAAVGLRTLRYIKGPGATGGGGTGGGKPALRLLPLGDSITWGTDSSTGNGYRGPLRSALIKDGFVADFVGERANGTMYDNYNDGFPGYTIGTVDSFVGSPVGKFLPNVITLMLGTNDMVFTDDPPNAPARLSNLIDDIYKSDPGVTVMVANIVASLDPAIEARIQPFNQALPGVVMAQAGQGRHVLLADMSAVNTGDINTSDKIHPTDGGYQKIADAFHSAIQNAVSRGWIGTPVDCVTSGAGCGDPSIKAGSEPAGTDPNAPSTGGGGSTSTTNKKVRYADFDGDGKADYIIVGDNGSLNVWYNRGGNDQGGWDGPYERAQGVALGRQVQLADFDGDGKVDYIVVNDDGSVRVLLNQGGDNNGGWNDLGHVANGTGPASQVRFADMDGDGKADYMQVSADGAVSFWGNSGGDGRGGWTCGCKIANGVAPSSQIQFADFDGDGKADYIVVAPDGSVDVWLNRGGDLDGGWQHTGKVANGEAPGDQIVFVDFDGDGRADYLVTNQSTGETSAWLNNGGDGRSLVGWVPQGYIALGVGAKGNQVMFADVTGDGKADYLVETDFTAGSVDAYINLGTQANVHKWADKVTIALGVGKQPNDVVLFGDVDGDALADYMVVPSPGVLGKAYYYANTYSTTTPWKWKDQSAKFFAPPTDGINKGDRTVLVDLTGDKKAELATIYLSNGAVTALLNQVDPNQLHTPDWTATDPNTPYSVATGVGYPGNQVWLADFDNDGKADYIVVTKTGDVQILQNQSGGGKWTWGKPTRVPGRVDCKVKNLPAGITAPPDFDYTQFADINGDGRADYLCVDRDTGAVRAWTNSDGKAINVNGWTPRGKIANGTPF